jgi:hypothetical protein
MINTLRRMAALGTAMATILFAAPVHSQAPTDAQRSAIRAQCRSDYQAHCSSVPPGGKASLQCLQQNMSSLSSGCQAAVRAIEAPAAAPKSESTPATPKAESAPAEPKTEATPAAETAAPPAAAKPPSAPKAAATAPAKKPSSAQVSAIRSACRGDYQQHCAGVPTGGAAALSCLEKNKAQLSENCQKAVSAASGAEAPAGGEAAAPAAGGAPAEATTVAPGAAPAAAPGLVLRAMRPREVIFVLRSACGADVRSLCGDVPPGGGRVLECLATHAASLSPACADILSQFAAR